MKTDEDHLLLAMGDLELLQKNRFRADYWQACRNARMFMAELRFLADIAEPAEPCAASGTQAEINACIALIRLKLANADYVAAHGHALPLLAMLKAEVIQADAANVKRALDAGIPPWIVETVYR